MMRRKHGSPQRSNSCCCAQARGRASFDALPPGFASSTRARTTGSWPCQSYSYQHPVCLALRGLGRVVRTRFLLRYMDDQSLRERIDDQLDKLESAHAFARAVLYGQNGQVPYAGKEKQQLADACKRLVQNTIGAVAERVSGMGCVP